MRAYVGVTDGDWYRYLAARPELTEANFWRPGGGKAFGALSLGEPFLFKMHHPHHRIVGGAWFTGFVRLSVIEAWEVFGQANGVETLEQLQHKVDGYRGAVSSEAIGCVMLQDLTFFPVEEAETVPADYARNVVQGKTYRLDDLREDSGVWRAAYRLTSPGVFTAEPGRVPGEVFGAAASVTRRLGQRSFQALVLDAYGRRCAVTQEKIRPVLQAAHILPVARGGEHRLDNGLLLRSDVHTLFDAGYLSVDKDYRLRVNPRIRREFDNGDDYYALSSTQVRLPERVADRPGREFLEWHNDVVFLSS